MAALRDELHSFIFNRPFSSALMIVTFSDKHRSHLFEPQLFGDAQVNISQTRS